MNVSRTTRWRSLLAPGVAVIVYVHTMSGQFVYDDLRFVKENATLRSWASVGRSFFTATDAGPGSAGHYRPIRTASWALDLRMWGLNPVGFHLANIAIHAINTALVYMVGSELLRPGASVIAALLFAVHPANTEVVAWISSRADELFLMFVLASFLVFVRSGQKRGGSTLRAVSLCLFAAGLLSKETAIVLPALLMGWDVWLEGASLRKAGVRTAPFWAVAAAYFFVRWFVRGAAAQIPYWGGSAWVTLLTMLTVIPRYVCTAFVPVGLNVDYYTAIIHSTADPRAFWGAARCALIALAAISLARRSARARFLLLWAAAAMVPVSNILPLKALEADRFLLMPLIALDLSLATLAERRSRFRLGLFLALLTFDAGLAVARSSVWRTEYSLWRDAAEKSPVSSTSLTNLAAAAWQAGARTSALRLFEKARAANPSNALVQFNLGRALLEMNRLGEAREALCQAAQRAPRNRSVLTELGSVSLAMGDAREAARWLSRAAKLPEAGERTYFNLGVALTRSGDTNGAIEAFKKAVEFDPSHAAAHFNLAALSLAVGQREDARIHALRAQRLGYTIPEGMRKVLKLRPCVNVPPPVR